jgi:purine-binding chemotaxis protein CheW
MDVRLRFGMEETQYNDRTCTIIVEHEKGEVGLIVDVVSEVLNIHDGEIMASNNGKVIGNEFLKGIVKVDETIKYVISFNNLIDSD